jgi:hypothetical protein
MSTIITFGSAGGPAGSSNATPIQFLLLDEGQLTSSPTDPAGLPYWDLSGSRISPWSPAAFKPSASVPRNAILLNRYWPAIVSQAFFREGLPSICAAGMSIRVSAAEAMALLLAGQLQLN